MIPRASPKQAVKVNRNEDESEDEANVKAKKDLALAVIHNST
jgi:hypothetical protein